MALYRVDESAGSLTAIEPTTLPDEGKRERGDLQRWLRDHPGALEPGLFVLAEEYGYGEWADSGRRIDLLALDAAGRLVVAELKRDEDPFMDLQAIRYAAMVAHMTFARAVDAHARYLEGRGIEGDAEALLREHLGSEDGAEPEIGSARPRILLAARDFRRELTAAVLWLRDSGLDIRCVRLLPYRVGGALVLDAAQVIPLPEAEDYMVRVRDREAEQERRTLPELDWTREDIERLAGDVRDENALGALDRLSETPGEWAPMPELVERIGIGPQRVGSAFGGLTQIVGHRFGRRNLPFAVEVQPGPDGDTERRYRMAAEVAERWRAARAAQGGDTAGGG